MKTNQRKYHEDDERMVHNPKGEKEKYSDIFEFRPGDDKLLRPLQIVYFKSSVISKTGAAIATNNEDSEENTVQLAPELQPAIEACTIVSAQDLQPSNEAGTMAPAKNTQPAIIDNYMDQELQPAIEVESTEQMLEHQPAMKADADDHSFNSQSVISSIMMIEPEADKFLEPPVVSPADLENDIITSDKAQTRRLYVKYFPNDKANNARSYNFMVNKLQKKGLKIANLVS